LVREGDERGASWNDSDRPAAGASLRARARTRQAVKRDDKNATHP